MRKTANYQLNQWDPGDRILREEFNADNARIDAAIAAVKAGNYYELLADVTTAQSCMQLDLDLSEIDFTRYSQLIVHPVLYSDTVHVGYIRLNGIDGMVYNRNNYLATICTQYGGTPGMGSLTLELGPVIAGRNLYSYQETGSSTQLISQALVAVTPGAIQPATLRQMNFYCANGRPLLAGTNVQVYGVRI